MPKLVLNSGVYDSALSIPCTICQWGSGNPENKLAARPIGDYYKFKGHHLPFAEFVDLLENNGGHTDEKRRLLLVQDWFIDNVIELIQTVGPHMLLNYIKEKG